jgi:cell wall-associated NlpC family hydrolase
MPPRHRFFRPARTTLVRVGLAAAALGGVAAAATVVLDAGSAAHVAPVASAAAVSTVRAAAERALTWTVTPAPGPSPVTSAQKAAAAHGTSHRTSRGRHATSHTSRSRTRSGPHPRPPRRPLRVGSHGLAVRWLQARLGVRHTGHFAGHTRSAVRTFQHRHHLRADGAVGRRTWVALVRTAHHRPGRHVHHHGVHHHGARHHARHHGVRHHGRHGHHLVLRRSRRLSSHQQIRRVLKVARAQRGKPYVWGAAGPRAFDCSGYVQWVFGRAIGRRLPKYTDTQYGALTHIRGSKVRPGDLVFVREGRHESHVGIYAGRHRWWVAPHTGSHVKLQRIWPARHVYARVIH